MYVPPAPQPVPVHPVLTRRDLHRKSLSESRQQFLGLLERLSDEGWRMRGWRTSFTAGEMMVHLYLRLATLPAALNGIRMGTGYLSIPPYMQEHATYWKVKTSAAGFTRRSLATAYEQAYVRAVAALESVGDEEWWLAAPVWGEPDVSVEALFSLQRMLLARYLENIRLALA